MKLFTRKKRETTDPHAALVELVGEEHLPTFPAAVATAIEKISDPHVDLAEVADVVASDPGLTITLLRLANSPAFSPRSPIDSLHHAVVLLGRRQLETLLMATGVNRAVPASAAPGFDPPEFWLRAATRAAAAGAIAEHVAPARRSEYYTAALLQDMAQPVLFHANSNYGDLLARCEGSAAELAALELKELGWTHADVGSLMCRTWSLPAFLTEAITVHHDEPSDAFAIVQWASVIEGPGRADTEALAGAEHWFGIDPIEGERIIAEARERAQDVASIFVV